METTSKDAAVKAPKEKGKVVLSTPGFGDITSANIVKYQKKVEQFLVDKKFGWFLSDTLGMTTSWKKGEKFDRFIGAMQDHAKDSDPIGDTTLGSICMNLEILAEDVAAVDPKSIVFESGSAAEREYGKSIDRRLEKQEKDAAVAAAVASTGDVKL